MSRHILKQIEEPGLFMIRVRNQVGVTDEIMKNIKKRPVTIAVLDSGVAMHPDLGQRVVAFRDFVNGAKEMYDDLGHGTHVCGIIAGDGRCHKGIYRGMAPESNLVVGKILGQDGNGDSAIMLKALTWIEENLFRYQIRILNISVGIALECDEQKRLLLQSKIERLWSLGVMIVCAAGNNGPGENTISALGQQSHALVVGCHDEGYCRKKRGCCENYSGRGKMGALLRKPDLVAPGTDIISCNAFFHMDHNAHIGFYTAKSGTSMATPIVTGALVLALQERPELTNEQLRSIITNSARDLGEPWNKQGFGMLNFKEMYASLQTFSVK